VLKYGRTHHFAGRGAIVPEAYSQTKIRRHYVIVIDRTGSQREERSGINVLNRVISRMDTLL
jgi:hypothetical protein